MAVSASLYSSLQIEQSKLSTTSWWVILRDGSADIASSEAAGGPFTGADRNNCTQSVQDRLELQ